MFELVIGTLIWAFYDNFFRIYILFRIQGFYTTNMMKQSLPPTLFHKSLFPYLIVLKGSQQSKSCVLIMDRVVRLIIIQGK